MITEIRRKFKDQGFKIIIWVMIISMIVVFAPSLFKRTKSPQMVLIQVNDHEIGVAEFQRRVYQEEEYIQMMRQQLGELAESFFALFGADPQVLAYRSLVQEALLDQIAKKLSIHLSPRFVMQKLHDPAFVMGELMGIIPLSLLKNDGTIDISLLQQYLQRSGLTMRDFEKDLEKNIRQSIVKDIVGTTIYVTNNEVKERFTIDYIKRNYELLHFPFEQYLAHEQDKKLTKDELKSFFEKENKRSKRYWIPEKRSGVIWSFSPKEYAITIADDKIDVYYKRYKFKKFVKEPAQVQVRRILFKVGQGIDDTEAEAKAKKVLEELSKDSTRFEELARQYSDDKKAALQGGLIDFFKKEEKDPAFAIAAFRLKEDGEISDVIATRDGFEILQRVDRKSATYKTLEDVKDEIETILQDRAFRSKFSQEVHKHIQRAQKDPKILNNFIAQKKAVKKEIPFIEKDDSRVAQKLFKLKKNGWGYYINDGNGILVNLTNIKKSTIPDLKTIEAQVKEDLYKKKAKTQLTKDIEKALRLAKKKSLSEIEKQFSLTKRTQTGLIGKDDNEKLKSLAEKGFLIQTLLVMDRVGQSSKVVNKDGYLLQLIEIEPFNEDEFEAKRAKIKQELYQNKKGLAEQAFVASLYRTGKIKTSKSITNA